MTKKELIGRKLKRGLRIFSSVKNKEIGGKYTLSEKMINDIKKQVVDELHKPARKNFKRTVIVKNINDLIHAHLVEM